MRKLNKLWLSLLLILGFSVQVMAQPVNGLAVEPIKSTTDNPIYYYIENAANGTVKMGGASYYQNYRGNLLYVSATDVGSDKKLRHHPKATITTTLSVENAIWQLLLDGTTTKLKNKGTALFFLDKGGTAASVATASTTGNLQLKSFNLAEPQYQFKSTQVNWACAWDKSAEGGNYIDKHGQADAFGANAWFFLLPNDNLDIAIINAESIFNLTAENVGNSVGKYSSTVRTTLSTKINEAKGIRDNGNPDDDAAAANELNQVTRTYLESKNLKVSTLGSDEYYYAVKTTDRGNRIVTNIGLASSLRGIVNATPTLDNTSEAQRWMFVKLSDGTYALVNKSTGHYIHPTPENIGESNQGFKPKETAITTGGWTVREQGTVGKYQLVKGTTVQFHQANGDNYSIINYYSLTDVGGYYEFIPLERATEKAVKTALAGGNVADDDVITFSSSTPGAKFYYTLDGSTPNALSPIAVDNKITINHALIKRPDFKLKVVTFANGYINSDVAEADYNITTRVVYWRESAENGNWTGTTTNNDNKHWWYDKWTSDKAQNRPDMPENNTANDIIINNNHQHTMTLQAWYKARTITFGDQATTGRSISSQGISFMGLNNAIINNSTATHTFNSNIGIDYGTGTVNPAVGDLVFAGIFYTNGKPIFVNTPTGRTVTISGNIQDGGNGTGNIFTKQGPGTLIVSNNCASYTGNFVVDGGVLELGTNANFYVNTTFAINNDARLRINRNLNLVNTTIGENATLEVAAGNTLTFGGNVVINGSVEVKNTAKLIINQNTTLINTTIENGATLEVAAGKQLTIGTGVVNNGTIILRSNATNGTATLVGNVSGNATVEQVADNKRTYYIGSPVSGSTMTHAGGLGAHITYVESTNEWTPQTGWSNLPNVLDFGKGYGVQVGASATDAQTTISFTGTLNNSPEAQKVEITQTDNTKGFNFLANPYPSYLDRAKVLDAATDGAMIEKTIWFYTRTKTSAQTGGDPEYKFVTCTKIGEDYSVSPSDLDIDGNVPPMQGFWVRANASGKFAFSNAMRIHRPASNPAFRAPQVSERQELRLQISNGTSNDEAVMLFSENANNDWNASKMMNPGLNIYTVKAGKNLVFNSDQAIGYDVETAVGVKAASGTYTFSAIRYENFGAEKAYLLDKAANIATDLTGGDYTVNFTEAYQGTDRFALVFPRSGVISNLENAKAAGFFAFASNKRISVNSQAQSGTIYVFNGLGQQVAAQAVNGELTTVSTVLPAGVYVVKLNNLTTKVVVK